MSVTIENESAYPIYSVKVRWVQDIDPSYDPSPWQVEGLPKGRIWNRTGWDSMYRKVRKLEEIKAELLREWWPKYEKKGKNPSEPEILVAFARSETWCPSWFSHWTFDAGLDDAAILRSFDAYVERMQEANRLISGESDSPVCLMGAEDRYRWAGIKTENVADGYTDPPCRCPGCKARGIVRIDL